MDAVAEDGRRPTPTGKVFVSSTSDDLRGHRAATRDAAIAAGLLPIMMEFFPASPNQAPLMASLDRVAEADVVVVIVAHRYGWVPRDQPKGERKSITWLECERALASGKDMLVFLVDAQAPWPEEHREEYDIVKALREGLATAPMLATVQDNVVHLHEFKQWLGNNRAWASFTSPEDLNAKVSAALHAWLKNRPRDSRHRRPIVTADPTKYLHILQARTAFIDIRGLQVGTGKAYRFPIEDLFVSLTTIPAARGGELGTGEGSPVPEAQPAPGLEIPLDSVLSNSGVTVVGDPGSGKTTFLRRVANALCVSLLGDDPHAAKARVGLDALPFPILVRLADLATYIEAHRETSETPATSDSAAWIPNFLAAVSRDDESGLDEEFFRVQLQSPCLVLLDGLDEVPNRAMRESLARLIESLALTRRNTRVVVTSRPGAYAGHAVLPGFVQVQIEPLNDEGVRTFLDRWCQALRLQDERATAEHVNDLIAALKRPAIRRMAQNPVMLTALAVVHWNERRLPEQRVDLYDSVIKWLARQREQRPRRPTAERCIEILQELALAMQNHRDGRHVQIGRRAAAEAIAHEFRSTTSTNRLTVAERFLDAEELDSGIVIRRGTELRFWHLTFQEFLAAKAIAARSENEQHSVLIASGRKLYSPEWQEVVLLLAGVLHGQGRPKIDGFISRVLDDLGVTPSLNEESRCVGLLGAVAQDLAPLHYAVADPRYSKLLERVLAIFEVEGSDSLAIEFRVIAAEALGQAGDPRLGLDNPQRWVSVSAGPFFIGAQALDRRQPNYDADARHNQSPVHEVRLNAYQIGRYPVTVSEYQDFVEHGGYLDSRWWTAGGFGESDSPKDWTQQCQFPNRPIIGVGWYEAAAYCRWAGCQLPTEAQWERAARGVEARRFPWGSAPPEYGWLNYRGVVGRPTPVGVFPRGATPDGIHDLAGNVWEWCLDVYDADSYQPSDTPNPPELADGVDHVTRGGSWYVEAGGAGCAVRYQCKSTYRGDDVGFRMVRTPRSIPSAIPARARR